MAAVVSPNDLTLLAPRRRLQGHLVAPSVLGRVPKLFPSQLDDFPFELIDEMNFVDRVSPQETESPLQLANAEDEVETSLSGKSVFWGGIIRVDVIKVIDVFTC
jgi:hypothetical protein